MLNLSDVKQALRERYAWPGGYPLFLVMCDGDAMSIDGARANWCHIVRAHLDQDRRSGWGVASVDVNWEDPDLICCQTGKPIESAYAPN